MTSQVLGGAFLSSMLSGFVPIVNGEVVAVSAALLVPPGMRSALLFACVTGQMLSKFCLYGLARWSPSRLPLKMRNLVAKAQERTKGRKAWLLVLASAGLGVPPFYLVTLAAGAIRLPAVLFVVAGVVGTMTRYIVVVWGATYFAR